MTKEERVLLKIDLCSRLPWGVKVSYRHSLAYSNTKKRKIATLTGFTKRDGYETTHRKYDGVIGSLIKEEGNNNISDVDFKPILYPLSHLTEHIIVYSYNGMNPFIPIKEFQDSGNWCDAYQEWWDYAAVDSEDYIQQAPCELIELLNQWHIDWRGLIDKGLAIDVTKLTHNPYAK